MSDGSAIQRKKKVYYVDKKKKNVSIKSKLQFFLFQ